LDEKKCLIAEILEIPLQSFFLIWICLYLCTYLCPSFTRKLPDAVSTKFHTYFPTNTAKVLNTSVTPPTRPTDSGATQTLKHKHFAGEKLCFAQKWIKFSPTFVSVDGQQPDLCKSSSTIESNILKVHPDNLLKMFSNMNHHLTSLLVFYAHSLIKNCWVKQ